MLSRFVITNETNMLITMYFRKIEQLNLATFNYLYNTKHTYI